MLKKLLIGVGALVVVLLVAKVFMLDRAPVPEKSTFVIDLPALRKLAMPGGAVLPEGLEVDQAVGCQVAARRYFWFSQGPVPVAHALIHARRSLPPSRLAVGAEIPPSA